jgi:hypothetical protein
MRRGITPVVAASALAALLAGCGMLPGQPLGGGGEERQPTSQGKQVANPAEPPEPAGQESAPLEQGKVIAGREVKVGGADLTVQITGLKRQGRLSTLTWTVTNKGDSQWKMTSEMGDTPANLGLTVAGISLVDPANGKRYAVARTGKYPTTKCLCSNYDVFTEPGEVLPLNATFAAPPPDVTKINVDLMVLGVFTDVPIS